MAKVWNKRDRTYPLSAVYVGRPTKFGNPFSMRNEVDRARVIADYKAWVWLPKQKDLRNQMRVELQGADLVCWCAPLDCHARIILEVVNTSLE